MVDRTAETFGMQPATSRGRNVPRRTRVEDQTEEAFGSSTEEPQVDKFSLPMGADPETDFVVGVDELGNRLYKSSLGVIYNIKTAPTQPEFTTEPATMARAGEIAKQTVTGAIEGITSAVTAPGRALAGQPVTTGEVLGTAGLAATGALPSVTRMAESYDPNVLGSNLGNVRQAGGKPKRPLVPRFERDTRQDAVTAFDDEFGIEDNPFEADMANAFFDTKIGELRNNFNIDVSDIPEIVDPEYGGGFYYLENIRLHDLINSDVKGETTEDIIDYFGMDPEPNAIAFVNRIRDTLYNDPKNKELIEQYKNFLSRFPDYDPRSVVADRTVGSSETRFRSPIESVVQQLEYPRDGIKGSQFLKELKDNPDVRDSEVAGIGLDIDPQKRYTQQELMDAVSGRLYDVTVEKRTDYSGYQLQSREGFTGPEKDYFELVVNAVPRGDNPGFKPLGKHYFDETLVHTRATISEDAVGDYIFVHELQSDLLQQGFEPAAKPKQYNIEEQLKITNDRINDELTKLSNDQLDIIDIDDDGNIITAPLAPEKTDAYKALQTWNQLDDYSKQDIIKQFADPLSTPRSRGRIVRDYFLWAVDSYFLDNLRYMFDDAVPKIETARSVPPIAKTEEAVRLAIDALMAEGQKRGVSRIVIPPLEKIVEVRAADLAYVYEQKLKRTVTREEAIKMAMEPTSGFYDTYVRSVNKVLDKYKKEFGDDFVVIQPYEIEYKYKNIFGYDQTEIAKGTEIDFSGLINKNYNLTRPRFAEGGMVDKNTETQMNRLMQEGGIADDGMRRDPVSGNEIPPGSMASEVRDDIPAQLSEGEYVVPADVLRYYGVAFFEKLRAKAKEGMAQMEQDGRIGGEPAPMRGNMEDEEDDDDEDELPFDVSELQTSVGGNGVDMQMASMGMAQGGMVRMQQGGMTPTATPAAPARAPAFNPMDWMTPGSSYFQQPQQQQQTEYRVYQNAQGQQMSIMFVNGVAQQPIPEGYFPQGQAPTVTTPTPTATAERESGFSDRAPPRDVAGEWAAGNYEAILSDPVAAARATAPGRMESAIVGLLPGGRSMMAANQVQKMEAIKEMALSSGNTAAAEAIQAQIDARMEDIGLLGKAVLSMSNPYTAKLQERAATASATRATTAPVAGGRTSAGLGERPATTARSTAASAPVGGRGTGAAPVATGRPSGVSSRGVSALEGPEAGGAGTRSAASASPAAAPPGAKSDKEREAERVSGAMRDISRGVQRGFSKGGLAARPQKQKAEKRKIKTTDA